jgi:streptogramin lyase
MQAHAAAGDPAEALRVYERCRRFLADELGAYPSPESEALYLELLRSSPGSSVAEADQLAAKGVRPESPAPTHDEPPPRRSRRKVAVLVAGALLVVGAATAAGVALATRDEAPPEVLPTSLVRLDLKTLKPTKVVEIGPRADLVVVAGGYVWVPHASLRYTTDGLRDAGDRTLTRVDPSTGETRPVGGGIAPCGIVPDPSGDVWVANCYASGLSDNVVRVNAKTLEFERTLPLRASADWYKGMAYGGGSLWVADDNGGVLERWRTLHLRTREPRSIKPDRPVSALAWSDGYGDLWMTDGDDQSVSRLHAETGDRRTLESVAEQPGALVVQGDSVWVGDWLNPDVVRIPAVGSGPPRHISLDVTTRPAGVTSVAAGAGFIWATVPDDHAVWRIDPRTNKARRFEVGYYPWGVAVADDGIWVAVRAHDALSLD